MLKEAGLKFSYSSENSSIVNDFYVPALKNGTTYDRAVGFFSSSSLSIAARGLAPLLESGGIMRLIIGYPVSSEDFDAIKHGIGISKHLTLIDHSVKVFFDNMQDNLECRRFDALSFLVASHRLQIRFAFRPRGMYHEKIGIIRDTDNFRVAFIGSANETENALSDSLNSESINAYFSWNEAIYKYYGIDIEERFEKLWRDEQPVTKTIPASHEFINKLADYHAGKDIKYIINALEQLEQQNQGELERQYYHLPKLPDFIGKNKYKLRDHQKKALELWSKNNYRGILKLATGSGKTVTALHACTKLSKTEHFIRGLCVVVAVPYQGLAEQWYEEMKLFNINALLCYKTQDIWIQQLKNQVSRFNLATSETFMSIIVVNNTLKKSIFLNEINKIHSNRILLISDECHNHANQNLLSILPNARLRLGLSATPWTENESEKQELLTSYYGKVVAEYGLREAIADEVLCPYDYFPVICQMNNEEAENYENLSTSIAKMEAIKENGGPVNTDALMHLYLKRTRLLGNLKSKLNALDCIIKKNGVQTHTLFYCGEGGSEGEFDDNEKSIDEVTAILHKRGWRTSKFTSEQSLALRRDIMESFKNANIDALVSKRVLDEGIDVPACSQAFLMASTRNERQYIQRRGRVLRRAPNKEKAIIFDFIVAPPFSLKNKSCFSIMMKQEAHRVEEFSRLSLNKPQLESDYEY
ncbi:DEAD/DEAH box helicase family protein [Pantoea sp. 22096]|uniref:DEAD/DEAH box helicase family protein n=1 Tax=Pantoea sp. 22096 TaxID=3453873 RepID=UPI003F83FF0F